MRNAKLDIFTFGMNRVLTKVLKGLKPSEIDFSIFKALKSLNLGHFFLFEALKGRYHESVSNVKYGVVSFTTVHREWCFTHSERFVTFPLVTSRIWPEPLDVITYPFSAPSS